MQLTLDQIVSMTGGRLTGGRGTISVNGISTDSRTIRPGELFVPLRGENFDGHDFLVRALRNGAAACLSEEVIAGLAVPVVQVQDTLRALGDLAAGLRRRFDGPLVAVTGSSGKTTTKEMLASILVRTAPGLKTEGNFNNLVGLPLTLFRLERDHRWAVVELGMSARGEIARLAEIAFPTVGIITNIGPAHLETLHGLDGVARAKGELFAALKPGGIAIFNADDPRVAALPVANGVTCIGYGIEGLARVRAERIEEGGGAVSFRLQLDDAGWPVTLKVPGRFHVYDALAAAAAALALEIPAEQIVAGLEVFVPLSGRMQSHLLDGGVILLEDYYNANPLSMQAALQALSGYGETGRRIGVLGDMLELGVASAELHRQIGRAAAESCDVLVTFGPQARGIADGAREACMQGEIVSCDDPTAVAEWLLPRLQPGDRLLLKGSRGMRMERIGNELRQAWSRRMADQN